MRTATILRAQAAAIIAEANARATTLTELADHLEAGDDDELLTLEDAGAIVGKTARSIRDAGRRGELEILIVGRSPRVSRGELARWAQPVAVIDRDDKPENDPHADAKRAAERAAERLRKVS
jgi:hypothetical protein